MAAREDLLFARCSDAERALVQRAAERLDTTVSGFVREVVVERARKILERA